MAVEAITPYGVGDRSGDAFDIDENAHNWSGGLRITIKVVAQSTETGEPEAPRAPELGEPQQDDDDDDDGFGGFGAEYRSALEARSAAPLPFVPIPEPKVRTRNPSPYRPKT